MVMKKQQKQQILSSSYDRSKCDIGIVHIGYGAFHRAHQAVYIDNYLEQTNDLRWGIASVNLRASESESFAYSASVKNGYILKTTNPSKEVSLQRVRPHCDFFDLNVDASKTEKIIAKESVHVVSITVRESGYYLDTDFSLDISSPIIAQELKGGEKLSIYAFLATSLKHRLSAHGNPLNILCCDNIRANGKMLERNFLTYLEHLGENDLIDWIKQSVSFPCSMVDRITPRASDDLKQEIADIVESTENNDPIHSEDFIQWVIEDNFKAPMPELDKVGVEIVADVDPYEEAKIRILNGGHTGICYFGAIKGYSTYDQAIADPELREIFDSFENEEVLPGLNIDIPFDKSAYLAEIASRFSNTAIADQLERICMDGYSKFTIFIKPTIESCLQQGITPKFSYLCIASWYVYAQRWASGHINIHYHEPYWENLEPLLKEGNESAFAQSQELWGELPERYENFETNIINAIREVETRWPA